ncbi:hypothetical protein SUGI_0413160 [Cryptomeria japonica]|nr:hypothetical protein SUGI_0413160 [Cryptomeria japonica]
MNLQNLALGAKLAWKMYNSPNKGWCKMMSHKYLDLIEPERIFTMANSIGDSPRWKLIWESRRIITDHLTWRLGDDCKAKFWRDSWNGDKALVDEIDDLDWINEMEASMGDRVADYIQEGCHPNSPIRWKVFDNVQIANSEKVNDILRSRIIHLTSEKDTLIWNASKSGSYKVNLGYKLQRRRQKDGDWLAALCWDKWVLPKAGAFLWIALHGKILASDRLKLIGIQGPRRCCLNKMEEETVNHLMYNCFFSRKCWDWLQMQLQNYMVYNNSFKEFIQAWPTRGRSSKWGSLWITSPSLMVWHVWKERNKGIFREKEMEVNILINKIQGAIEETINGKICGNKYKYYSKWDREME